MKTKQTLKMKLVVLITIIIGGLTIQGCSSSDDGDTGSTVDKSVLEARISVAEDLLDVSVEGTAEGLYLPGSKAKLQAGVDLAQGVLDNAASTQVAINNTVTSLNATIAVFEGSIVVPVDPTNLIGQWTFDEGTGTTAGDSSGNNFDGTFGNEPGFGFTTTPSWTTDRYGNTGKAVAFSGGSKITVPYNVALNPGVISISLWINATEIREGNRFMGLHSWNGFKFQLQATNTPFFTGAATDAIYDRDAANSLEINTWYHIAVTFGNGNTKFYINGTLVQTWTETTGTLLPVQSGNDLVFGIDSSEYATDDTNYETDKIIPIGWGGYFEGSLDEIRIYKSVLSDSQVQVIYQTEKVPTEDK